MRLHKPTRPAEGMLRIWSSYYLKEIVSWSSYDDSPRSLKKVYPQFVPRNREDYPSAVDEDDLPVDASIEVRPIQTILYSQGLPSAEDCFSIFDDETSCLAVLCDPKESAAQYFINDEDLFGRLITDSDYLNQHGGDHGGEDIEGEQHWEEDMLFGSGWESDETVTDARFLLYRKRDHEEEEEIVDVVALQATVIAEDDAKYFDAEDLFEREEEEMLVYGRDGCLLEDWDL